jgi:hypothetical protein
MAAKTLGPSEPSRLPSLFQEERLGLTRGCEHESDGPSFTFTQQCGTPRGPNAESPGPGRFVTNLDDVFTLNDMEPLVLIPM